MGEPFRLDREKYRQRCRHFTGIQNKRCNAGVRYDDFANRDQRRPSRAPKPGRRVFASGSTQRYTRCITRPGPSLARSPGRSLARSDQSASLASAQPAIRAASSRRGCQSTSG